MKSEWLFFKMQTRRVSLLPGSLPRSYGCSMSLFTLLWAALANVVATSCTRLFKLKLTKMKWNIWFLGHISTAQWPRMTSGYSGGQRRSQNAFNIMGSFIGWHWSKAMLLYSSHQGADLSHRRDLEHAISSIQGTGSFPLCLNPSHLATNSSLPSLEVWVDPGWVHVPSSSRALCLLRSCHSYNFTLACVYQPQGLQRSSLPLLSSRCWVLRIWV